MSAYLHIMDKPTKPDIQENAGRMPDGKFPPGVSGNPAGRPKRKTLTELIHAKLDDTPEAWNAIINTVIKKILEDKDKEIIKTFWNYTDGMPTQRQELTGKDGDTLRPMFVVQTPEAKKELEALYEGSNSTNDKGVS